MSSPMIIQVRDLSSFILKSPSVVPIQYRPPESSNKQVARWFRFSNPNNISSNQVRDFVEDNFGNIWFGTFTGLNKYNPTSNQFEVYARNPLPGSMTHSSVFPVYKDRQGTIWLGLEGS